VSLTNDGTVQVWTNNSTWKGSHEMYVTATLKDYTTQVATTTIPFEFSTCSLTVTDWVMKDVNVTYTGNSTQLFEEPVVNYDDGLSCGYKWVAYDFSLANATSGKLIEDKEAFVKLNADQKMFSYQTKLVTRTESFRVAVTARLSDGVTSLVSNPSDSVSPTTTFDGTTAKSSHVVTFFGRENTAPYFITAVKSEY